MLGRHEIREAAVEAAGKAEEEAALMRAFGVHKGERGYADAMGCGWMTNREARQAIPPAYTHLIGERLRAHLVAA